MTPYHYPPTRATRKQRTKQDSPIYKRVCLLKWVGGKRKCMLVTGRQDIALEIVCWSSVVSCACELFLLLSVVACCAQIWRLASYTHRTPHTRRPVGGDRCSDVFHRAFLCKVNIEVQAVTCAVKAQTVLVSGWQAVTVQTSSGCLCNTSLYRLSYLVCLRPGICQQHGGDCGQPRHIMMAGSGTDSACQNVRTGISIFLIYEGCIHTVIIPVSKKKHFSW